MKVINKENKTPIKINHPVPTQLCRATPPSKGGDTYTNIYYIESMLSLTAMPLWGAVGP